MGKYNHLSLEEREKIFLWKHQGISFRKIGERLKRDHKTISRDWKEGNKYFREYIPCKVHERAEKRLFEQRRKAPLKKPLIFLYVREKLKLKWSPELIAGRLSIDFPGESIHFETIYEYIYGKGKEFKLWRHLARHRKKRKHKNGRGNKSNKTSRIPGAISIKERPKKINKRKNVGHFETDLMEGNKKDKAVITIDVERKTRYVTLTKLPNKKAKNKLKSMEKELMRLKCLKDMIINVMTSFMTKRGNLDGGTEDCT